MEGYYRERREFQVGHGWSESAAYPQTRVVARIDGYLRREWQR